MQLVFAVPMAVIAALYTILGGLRAVAVMDTFSGIGVLAVALLVVVLALNAIGWDFSGIPPERLTMVGSTNSPIPFHTLFTGMLFIQIFYWSTNQIITQKAMTAPTVREAQKGVLAAAVVRDDDRVGGVQVVAHPDLERALGEVDRGGLGGEELGAEAAGLLAAAHHQLGAHDALGEAGEVLDLGREHQLAAGLVARATRFALDDEGSEVGAGGVDRSRQPGRARADDENRMVAHAASAGLLWRRRSTTKPTIIISPPVTR